VEHTDTTPPPEPVRWLELWDRLADKETRRGYVASELQRILEEGWPPLYAVMTLPLAEQRDVALSVLRALRPIVHLRLAPGAQPPPVDPHGYPLPPAKAGRVAVLKVATNGADKGADEDGGRAWTGSARMAALRPNSPRPLYAGVEIGPEPTPVTIDHAAHLMARWGYGVLPERFKGTYGIKVRDPQTGQQSVRTLPRDRWLLIEAPEGSRLLPSQPEKSAAPAPQGKGRAA
jgi:hypothetical protein